jgi:two-component system sensor histidine kinase ChvG
VLLVGIFIALPIFLYFQLESGDAKLRGLVTRGIEQRNWLIAAALKPVLETADGVPNDDLRRALSRFGQDGTIIKLMYQRPAPAGDSSFYYVASVPAVGQSKLDSEFHEFERHGTIPKLEMGCTAGPGDVERSEIDPKEELLTSIFPVRTKNGCWAIIISHSTANFLNTPIGRPYWQSPEVSFAAMIYLALALLILLIALSVWRSIRTFGAVARRITRERNRDQTFVSQNAVPEFASIAEDFDGLVATLRGAAHEIRQSAEDNAHSFKGPIATVIAALGALQRSLPDADPRQRQLMQLMGASLRRLTALIFASQRMEELNADLLDAPRTRVNLTALIADVLLRYGELCSTRGIKLARHLDEEVFVRASGEPLTEAIENILDNAISFAPPESLIDVRLARRPEAVELVIQDEGPGIEPDRIRHVFERYYSLREDADGDGSAIADTGHAGLGLWIVRRNIEALGGTVRAANRASGGLIISAVLPSEA